MLQHFQRIPDGKKDIILELKCLACFSKIRLFNINCHAVLKCKQENIKKLDILQYIANNVIIMKYKQAPQ